MFITLKKERVWSRGQAVRASMEIGFRVQRRGSHFFSFGEEKRREKGLSLDVELSLWICLIYTNVCRRHKESHLKQISVKA